MKDTIYYPMLDEIVRYAFEKQPAEFREWVEGCDAETTVVELSGILDMNTPMRSKSLLEVSEHG